jgi:hypothetical protein
MWGYEDDLQESNGLKGIGWHYMAGPVSGIWRA